ncbi:IclR family transcriptional regulator [Rhodospirillaceae bacterium KN72]|uniref:IclR family transcriptional regulator n=1 Tax=Pacificispira spongiicola TaxID=2729598 RepID=A0A7Y0DXA3_9PROT|nr:IclR family transcriptional regulator [Pacificispira spongiicola]NMM43324.1 IclR family transcriptional regulator [Pacificispira spongiicola]
MSDVNNSNQTNQSTVAAFSILEEMATHVEPSRVTDLANTLGMPRARVYRYLQTLVTLGYVRQDPATERYRLTLKLFHLGQAIADGTQLTSVARPVMVLLRDKVGQTVTLSIAEDNGMRVLDIVRVETPVQIITKPGALLDFHRSAQGKLALAFGKSDYRKNLEAALKSGDPSVVPVDPDWLEREIAHAHTEGWAVAPEETLPGVNAISAPIFDSEGRFAATITIVGSVQDIAREPAEALVAAVKEAAGEISADLGYMETRV